MKPKILLLRIFMLFLLQTLLESEKFYFDTNLILKQLYLHYPTTTLLFYSFTLICVQVKILPNKNSCIFDNF
jgi:hypothetical protein